MNALVDQWVEAAFQYFLVGNIASFYAEFFSQLFAQRDKVRIAGFFPALVKITAAAGFLAISTELVEFVLYRLIAGVLCKFSAARFAHAVTDIDAGKVGYRDNSHRHAEIGEYAIDLFGCRAFEQHSRTLTKIGFEHTVANETEANADHRRYLAYALREL